MKRWQTMFLGVTLCSLAFAPALKADPTVFPLGTTIYSPAEAYNSYILIPEENIGSWDYSAQTRAKPTLSDQVFLIDMNGNIVHTWTTTNCSSKRDRLLPDGNLLHLDQRAKKILEYDWDSKVVWEYKVPEPYTPHHDVRRLDNGNTLILCAANIPDEYQDKVRDFEVPGRGLINRQDIRLVGDSIIEVTPKGEIVWVWNSWEHLDVNRFSITTSPEDWTHGNTCSVIPPNRHYDAGDQRFKPGNVVFNPRSLDEVVVIDKDTGEIVYTWTNSTYFGGIAHGHEPEMIPAAYPGGGNFTFYDNGMAPRNRTHTGNSYLHEFDPVTDEIVWTYHPKGAVIGGGRFYSYVKSTVTKLPNGNVFASEDVTGRLIQIKADKNHPDGGEIVWEYMHRADVGRPRPYPYDYCPQMATLPVPKEMRVTPPDRDSYRIIPDELR